MSSLKKHVASGGALVVFALLAVGSGGKKDQDKASQTKTTSADEAAPKIGDTVTFDDSTWVVASAKNLGHKAKATSPFGDDKKTDGQFIEVQFKVTNKQSKDDSIVDGPKLVDSSGREFGHFEDEALLIPSGQKTIILETLPPSLSKEFWSIFEVPADATGLKFQVRSLDDLPTKKLVDLGPLPAPAVAQAATTTPTAHAAAPAHTAHGSTPSGGKK
jgi:hypothetical protein